MTDAARIGTAFVDVKGDFTSINKQVAGFAARLGKTGKFAVGAATGVAAVGTAAVAAGKALYDIGSEFDDAYDKIRVGTGKTGKQLGRLKKDFKNVVSSVPADFGDAAEAIAGINSRLGLTGKPLRKLSKQMLELSRVTETDLGGNIKNVTRAFGDWAVPVKKQSATLDLFFRASQKSGASVADLTDLIVKFGSPLRQLGFNVGEATAMFASFEKSGVNIQTMVPGLKLALGTFLEQGRDPGAALKKTFKGIETGALGSTEILKIFGKRAGADMVEAVEQGRFHLAKFQQQIENGNDTVMKAGRGTMDASEKFKLLGNKLKVLIEPAATAVFNAVGDLAGALAKVDFKKALKDAGPTLREIADIAKRVWKVIGPGVREALKQAGQYFKNFAQVIKGIIQVISGILSGDFGKAWKGVKNIFSGYVKTLLTIVKGMTAPLRNVVGKIGDAMGKGFSAAWDGIKGLFKDGVNTVIGWLNTLIDAINFIPGIPDIGHIGEIGGRTNSGTSPKSTGKDRGGKPATGKARGGPIFGGDPVGDSVLAVLERGEYVLNRKAVAAIGQDHLDAINFKAAPRFSVGGDVWGAVTGAAKKAVTPGGLLSAAGDIVNKGPGYFIDRLPKPHLPEPFSELGPYVIGQVTNFIKDGFKSKKLGKFTGLSAGSGPVQQVFAKVAKRLSNSKIATLALGEAGFAESGMRDLPGGDASSQGALQLLASTAAGMGIDPHDEGAIASAFLLRGFYGRGGANSLAAKGMPAHLVAQGVQGSAFSDGSNYLAQEGAAKAWMRRFGLRRGGLIGKIRRLAGGGMVDPSWDPGGETIASSIAQLVGAYAKRYDIDITAGYDPGGGHVSPGHNTTGTATDVVPRSGNWGGAFEQGLGLLAKLGFEVGYDGSIPGTESWPGHGRGNHAHIEWVGNGTAGDARQRLRDYLGGIAGGTKGLSEAQQTQAEAKARKKQREGQLAKLRSLVSDSTTLPAKQSALWKLLKFWGRVGIFDQGERSHILDTVQSAAAQLSIEGRTKILSHLGSYATKHGEITGRDPENWHSMTDAIEKAQERGQKERERTVEKHKRQRARKVARIAARGNFAGLAQMLQGHEGTFNRLSEGAERLVALEPEDLTDDYVGRERGAWSGVLDSVAQWRDKDIFARNTAVSMRQVFEGDIQKIQELKGTPAYAKQKWRLAPLREAVANANAFISERAEDLVDFQGLGGPQTMLGSLAENTPWWLTLGGPGRTIFDTQNTIRELGVKVGGGGGTDASDSERVAILEQLLRQSNQRTAVSESLYGTLRQFNETYPYMGAFAKGGVALVGERGPELAHMPSGTRVHSASDTAGLLSPPVVNVSVNVERGAGVDPSKIRTEVEGAIRNTRGTGRITPGGGTRF